MTRTTLVTMSGVAVALARCNPNNPARTDFGQPMMSMVTESTNVTSDGGPTLAGEDRERYDEGKAGTKRPIRLQTIGRT